MDLKSGNSDATVEYDLQYWGQLLFTWDFPWISNTCIHAHFWVFDFETKILLLSTQHSRPTQHLF